MRAILWSRCRVWCLRRPIMTIKILAVGEVLWDLLPSGKQLGGAPANFTYHCRSLGADACLVTRVGDDGLGRGSQGSISDPGHPGRAGPGRPDRTHRHGRRYAVRGRPAPLRDLPECGLGSDRRRPVRPGPGRRCGRHLLRQPRPAVRAHSGHDPIADRCHPTRGDPSFRP